MLHGEVRLRVREIMRQVCAEVGATIVNGALSRSRPNVRRNPAPGFSASSRSYRVTRSLIQFSSYEGIILAAPRDSLRLPLAH